MNGTGFFFTTGSGMITSGDVIQDLISSDGKNSKSKKPKISDRVKKYLNEAEQQRLKGLIECEKFPLAGRIKFLERLNSLAAKSQPTLEAFETLVNMIDFIRGEALNELCLRHLKESFEHIECDSDGNCLFQAVSHHFQHISAQRVRQNVAKFIENNMQQLRELPYSQAGFKEEDESFNSEDYLKTMRNPKGCLEGWGGIREVHIIAHCISRTFVIHAPVFTDDDGEYTQMVVDKDILGNPITDTAQKAIHLYWNGRSHFDLLIPKKSEMEGSTTVQSPLFNT